MTFNKNGDTKQKPDKKYVNFVKNYFPGTIISANEWKQFKWLSLIVLFLKANKFQAIVQVMPKAIIEYRIIFHLSLLSYMSIFLMSVPKCHITTGCKKPTRYGN